MMKSNKRKECITQIYSINIKIDRKKNHHRIL